MEKIHKEGYEAIEVSYVYPPIPLRCYDWSAVFEGYDGAEDSRTRSHVGWGATKEEAVQNLLDEHGEDGEV